MKKTNIKLADIAKICGVSTATVSLVLSDNPRISKETKKKVLEVIKRLGYYPNISARTLSTDTTKTLCVVLPQIPHVFSDPFFGEALSGVYDYASKNGYRILFEVATYEFCFYKRYLQLFKERSIDGMLYIGSTLNDTYLVDIEREGYPFILVGSYFPDGKGPQLSYVIGDNVKGGYLATKHLINLGHRRIAFITGHFKVISARDRFLGYKQALKEAGIQLDKSLIVKADFDEQTGYQAMRKLFDRFGNKVGKEDGFTAVFAGNDLMALGAIRAIKEKGLKVPEDVAVVGMDNIRMSSIGESPLTTVEYNVYQMGKIACQKIIEQIEKKSVYQIKEVLPVKLIIRNTCGAKSLKNV